MRGNYKNKSQQRQGYGLIAESMREAIMERKKAGQTIVGGDKEGEKRDVCRKLMEYWGEPTDIAAVVSELLQNKTGRNTLLLQFKHFHKKYMCFPEWVDKDYQDVMSMCLSRMRGTGLRVIDNNREVK